MHRITVAIIGSILLIGALFFVFRESPPITNHPSSGKTIVVFGDSLAEGVGATKGNDFASLLSKEIGEQIINMGVSGNTSAAGLERIDEVIGLEPKVVMVLFGGNDFLRKVPIAETFKNVDDIVVRLQTSGAVVVLLGVRGGILTDGYDEYFEEIAKARGALYVPNVLSGLLGRQEFMNDGIHPNDLGYKKIADRVYPVLKKAL